MQKYTLKADNRKTTGRKVKQLRKKGILPGNVYGKKIKSVSVEVQEKEFIKVFQKAGETGIVELDLAGKNLPVLIHNLQYHPVSNSPLHVDFYQVNLKEKVSAEIPVVFKGEAEAVKNKTGVLLSLLSEIEVEALPADLPEKIEVEVSGLKNIDEAIKVSDLKIKGDVKIVTDANLDVVKVAPLVSKEAEKMAAEEQAAAAAAETATAEASAEKAEEGTSQKAEEAKSPQGEKEDKSK